MGSPDDVDTVAPQDRLLDGRWEVGEVLGRGAVADVFAGRETATGEPVAVKVVRVTDGEAVTRFEREIEALEGVDHDGIVAVLGHGELADGRPFVVLQQAGGGTLEGALARGPLGPDAAAALGGQLGRALHHAHERGVVHRDVKPANVLLDGAGRPMLADFGIAQLAGSATLTVAGWTVGTPAYLAPEQLLGGEVGPAADVYALGLVVLEAATGERVFPGDGMAAALARLDRPVEVPDSLPSGLAAALRAMTASEPGDRPSAAGAADLLAAGSDAGATTALPVAATATTALPQAARPASEPASTPAPPVRPGPGWSRDRSRRALVAGAAVAGAALLALGLADGISNSGWLIDQPATTTTTSTTVTTTTTPPTTAPPPEEDDDEGGRGNGNGNGNGDENGNGNGNGRGRDDDD
jgi:serine/threonine protein kinase